MKLSASSYKSTLKIEDKVIRDESDYIKVDDTWLKVYKIMLDQLRDDFLQDRRAPYKEKEVAKYINLCKDQMARKRGIISRAGEMVCRYLELDEE
jgi:hypothetical protein